MATRFFICTICGNVVVKVVDSGVVPVCCGKQMQELIPGVSDAAHEKHVPVVEKMDGDTIRVKVGALPHPMTEEHGIRFIYLETTRGGQIKYLRPGMPPEADFRLCNDTPVAVYEYCNLHGLWKSGI